MECGIRQGALEGSYRPEWLYDNEQRTITTGGGVGSRFQINRHDKLEDFSLLISPVAISDSSVYKCDVKIALSNPTGNDEFRYVTSPEITLYTGLQ